MLWENGALYSDFLKVCAVQTGGRLLWVFQGRCADVDISGLKLFGIFKLDCFYG